MDPKTQEIINALDLSPHPEGGYYKETYRSEMNVETEDGKSRSAATGIYFLLTKEICTSWHHVSSDELWHFYKGDPLVLEIINEQGKFSKRLLNDELTRKGQFQQLIPKNCWQRAYSTGEYTLVGCTVSPGFEFEDFEMIEEAELAEQFSEIRSDIVRHPFD